MLWPVILVPLSIYLAFTAAVYVFQPRLLYFPEKHHEATPEQIGLPFESITFKTADGVRLHGWFIPAESSRGTVLFCHGNAGNISHRLFFIELLNRIGMNTFIFDYRGYGLSEGKPTEAGTYLDGQAAWVYLVSERKIPAGEIVIQGRSIGGSVAAKTARDVKPAALIVESSFTSVRDIGAEVYPYLPVRWLSRFDYSTLDYLKGVSCPVLIVHSPGDEIIPISHGRRLYEEAAPPKAFLEIRGGHNDGPIVSGDIYSSGLESFIDRYVKK